MPGKQTSTREIREKAFIEKSVEKYGEHYDYSLVEYEKNNVPVKIRCNIHDVVFEQRPGNHLTFGEYSCPVCNRNRLKAIQYLSYEEILERFKIVHGDKYDYSKFTEWQPYGTKIEIICPFHGSFKTHIHTHYNGGECPTCARYKTSQLGGMNNIQDLNSEKVHLYLIEFNDDKYNFLKVGLTSRSVKLRFKPKQYRKFNLVTILDIEVPAIVGIERERRALEQFSDSRYYLPRGESFKGCTELFRTDVKSDLIRLLESNE